jgi:hypothetical protein
MFQVPQIVHFRVLPDTREPAAHKGGREGPAWEVPSLKLLPQKRFLLASERGLRSRKLGFCGHGLIQTATVQCTDSESEKVPSSYHCSRLYRSTEGRA